ncbi:MAG: PEP/pyruvate-binding domain-containing protein, partial [Bacillota bacterium]
MGTQWLRDVGRDDVAVAGGKGANLGEMIRLGMPVPTGFVVTAPAYAEQVARWDLLERLAPLVGREAWEEASHTAEELLLAHPMEEALAGSILTAYREMGSPAVAVRSSATAEDLAEASFAGQQESFLNVQGEAELLRAVRRCWASLWSPRALHYRHQRSIEHATVSIAVVVQEMVPAEAAGVLFTVDPVAQRADRMLVEAAHGLGEAVVSGQVTGEVCRIERERLTVVEREGGQGVLTDAQLAELGGLALKLEAHYGCPQDVEFALAGGQIYLLQTRPITTLTAQPEELPPPPRLTAFQQRMIPIAEERYPSAPKPLDNLLFARVVGAGVYALKAGHFRFDPAEEADLRNRIWHQTYLIPNPKPTLRALLGLLGRTRRTLDFDWQGWWSGEPVRRLLEVTAPVDPASLDDRAVIERTEAVVGVWNWMLNERFVASGTIFIEGLLEKIVARAVGSQQATILVGELLGGIETRTTETNSALWELSREARKEPAVLAAVREGRLERLRESEAGRAFLVQFDRFLQEYGHREGSCWYLSTPCWRQDPAQVWRMLSGLVSAEQRAEGKVEWEKARDLVAGRLRWPLRGLFLYLVDRLRKHREFRENSHFDLTRPLPVLQELAEECGRRLVDRGILSQRNDLFYLTWDEVKAWLTGRAPGPREARELVARRRATYQVVNGRWQASFFRPAAAGSELKGIGASPGVVRARARIIRDESQFHRMQPGEVMVCRYTNPAWTPLFVSAAAVVTETGGAG